jgi:N-acyl-phosphatidylethanolamine-hydrolysing phospholipase D
MTLWNSYLVIHRSTPSSEPHPLLFHAGDTGYVAPLYSEIASVYGSGCELALLPIGSYCPRWHLRPQHCDPQDVVKMHLELGAKRTVGVHYATWILSDEHYLAPPRELCIAAEESNVSASVIPGQMGRTMVIPLVGPPYEEGNMGSDGGNNSELTLKEVRGGKCILWLASQPSRSP